MPGISSRPLRCSVRLSLRTAALVLLCSFALLFSASNRASADPAPASVVHYLDGDRSTFIPGGPAQFFDADPQGDGMGLAVVSADPAANFAGGYLLVTQVAGAPDGSFSFFTPTVSAGGDGQIAAGEAIATANSRWQAVGIINAAADGRNGRPLRIDFTGDASALAVEDIVISLMYGAPTGGERQFMLLLDAGDHCARAAAPVYVVMAGE